MRSTLRVQFIGLEGLEEAGVGEGVAKEFIVDVLRAGFEPSAGLFCAGDDGALFPDPAALVRVPDALAKFEWLGAVLGKALFEGILGRASPWRAPSSTSCWAAPTRSPRCLRSTRRSTAR